MKDFETRIEKLDYSNEPNVMPELVPSQSAPADWSSISEESSLEEWESLADIPFTGNQNNEGDINSSASEFEPISNADTEG